MAVEWVIQGMGAALTQISTVDCSVSFWASTAAAWFVTLLLLLLARFPHAAGLALEDGGKPLEVTLRDPLDGRS